jgi:hypothetical protein
VRFLPRGGRVALPQILTSRANILPDVATVTARVAAIAAQIAPVVTNFMTISGGISRLLRTRRGGYADGERQQRGDDGAVSHDRYLEKLESWLRRQVNGRVNRYREYDREKVSNVTRTAERG